MIVARSCGVAAVRRSSSPSSEMSAPRLVSTLTALSVIDQTWLRSSRLPRTSVIRAMWSAPSATTARAPESRRIHSIWSAEDVS